MENFFSIILFLAFYVLVHTLFMPFLAHCVLKHNCYFTFMTQIKIGRYLNNTIRIRRWQSRGCSIWIATKVNECCGLWLCFLSQTLFPSDLFWKYVYILIFGIKFFLNFSNGHPLYDLGHFSKVYFFLKKWKITQIILPFEKFEKKFYSKNQNVCTHFQHKSEGKSI